MLPDSDTQTPEQKLLSDVQGIIAEYEHAKILERTTRGRIARFKAGYPPTTVPLGYRYLANEKTPDNPHGRGGSYIEEPKESAIVRRIFSLYIERGLSFERIAELLTAERVPTKGAHLRRSTSATQWHAGSVRYILTSETYVGTLYYGKRERIEGRENPERKTRWRTVLREQWIPIPVPQIIDEATFHAAQQQIKNNTQGSRRNRKHEYLLVSGRLRCGHCGYKMHGFIGGHGWRAYRCLQPRYRRIPHTKRNIYAEKLESQVWQAVEKALHNPQLIAAGIERRRQGANTKQGDLDREKRFYQGQIVQCDKAIQRWEAAYIGEAIDLEDFKQKKADIDARCASLEAELARLDEQQRLIKQTHVEMASLRDYCSRVAKNLKSLGLEEKRLVAQALDITVTWYPDKPIEITGSIPVNAEIDSTCRADRQRPSGSSC